MADDGTVIVFRNEANEPIAVPGEIVTLAERQYRCHLARMRGDSWALIALDENYPSAQAAASDVKRYLAEGAALVTEASRRESLALEVARLDRYTRALDEKAMEGNVGAISVGVNIVMKRAELLGLLTEDLSLTTTRTVVVPLDDGYAAALRELVDRDTLAGPTP